MMKRILKYIGIGLLLLVGLIFVTDYWVSYSSRKQLYDNIEEFDHHKVGLLLGTSKYVSKGVKNVFYKYRIAAAVKLFNEGKIDFILVSGDNRQRDYNEPETMRRDLLAAGIPESRIVLDYAGFRTLDSVVRCKEVFGETDIIIISQKFHNERAICLANKRGLDAIAYNAGDPPADKTIKVMIREKFARVKMVLDLITSKQPKFLGERIFIEIPAAPADSTAINPE